MKKSVFSIFVCVLIFSLLLPAAPKLVQAEGDTPPAPTPTPSEWEIVGNLPEGQEHDHNFLQDLALSTYVAERFPARMDGHEPREYTSPSPEIIALTQQQVQSFVCADVTDVSVTECEALVALYNSTNGAGWINSSNWLVTNTVDDWYGVTVTDGHVSDLYLSGNNLSGSIPSEIGNLLSLSFLSMNWNLLTGSIPSVLGNLTNLEYLELTDNQLSGNIPGELSNLTNLWFLDLSSNQLTGNIPVELGSLVNLIYLHLHNNQLTGSIPTVLGGLVNLGILWLSSNQLTGTIPAELGNLTNLWHLDLSSNQLSGSIPAELGNIDSLQDIILSNNQLSGNIPPELGSIFSLHNLNLSSNQLNGSIPSELGDISYLFEIRLNSNQLSGSIPLSFTNLNLLEAFHFYSTSLCEPDEPNFLAWKATVSDWQGTGVTCQTLGPYKVFLPLIRNGSLCLNAPTLLDPANGSSLDNLIPLFRWDNGNDPNATGLRLEVARDADFTQPVTSLWGSGLGGIQEFRYSRNYDPSTALYWRAYLTCGETNSPYSSTWSFTTGSGGTVLPAPSLLAPADDTILPSLPVDLEWEAVNGAVEYIVHWTLTGHSGYSYYMTTDTNITIGWWLDPNTTYDWWVTARNEYAWGVDSEKWQFTTPAEALSISHTNINHTYSIDEEGVTYLTAE